MPLIYRKSLLLLFLLPQLSSSNTLQGQRFGEWWVQCEAAQDKENACHIQQLLGEKGGKDHLMTTIISYNGGRKFPTLTVKFPKGVIIEQEVHFKVDRYNPVSFEGICDGQGCRAGLALDNPLTQQISKGKMGLLGFKKKW